MKVLICIPSLAIGGAEKFAVDLAAKLKQDNYDVVVAETRTQIDSIFRRTLEGYGIKIVDLAGKSFFEMLKKQIRYLGGNHFDVIHANTGSVLHTMFVCWLLRIPKRFYTIHNEPKLLYGNSQLKKYIYKMAFLFFGFVPVAISQTIHDEVAKAFSLGKYPIPVVNNGVDTDRYIPAYLEKSMQGTRIISVGRLCWIKNQEMIINATTNLHKRGYEVYLDILGDGEDRDRLEAAISRNNAESYVVLHGRQANVETYLQQSDIYVSASKTEGLPLSILEAMACGLPIVATDAGGTKDIVHNGENGYLIPLDNQVELEEAIVRMIRNAGLRNAFGRKSRAIAEQWSLSNCAKKYEMLYEGNIEAKEIVLMEKSE